MLFCYYLIVWCTVFIAGRDSAVATGLTLRGSNPGENEIFRTVPVRPRGPRSRPYRGQSGQAMGLTFSPPPPSTHLVPGQIGEYSRNCASGVYCCMLPVFLNSNTFTALSKATLSLAALHEVQSSSITFYEQLHRIS